MSTMFTSCHDWHLIFVFAFIVMHRITNAQPEELFYSFNFGQRSDWIEESGSLYPIFWLTGHTSCPRGNTGGPCAHLKKDATLSRTIPTIGYHSIRLQIDARAVDVETISDEWCFVQYRTEEIIWQNVNVVQGAGHWALDFEIIIPDTNSYNNQESFQVKVGINAHQSADNCYFANLRIFGIPYTQDPTNPSASPSNEPSFNPSMNPTKISLNPSQFPSKYPTVQPTSSTGNPSRIPSVHPSNHPSHNPTNVPNDIVSTSFMAPIDSVDTDLQTWILVVEIGACVIVCAVICFLVLVLRSRRSTTESEQSVVHNRLDDQVESNIVVVKDDVPVHGKDDIPNAARVGSVSSDDMDAQRPKHKHTISGDDNANLEIADDEFVVRGEDENEDASDMEYWLQNVCQLPQYYDCFVENGYEKLEFVKNITTPVDLQGIGIVFPEHQHKLLREIRELKNDPKAVAGQMRTQEGD
eukprot:1037643_1